MVLKVQYKFDMAKTKNIPPTKPRRNTPRLTSKPDIMKSSTQQRITHTKSLSTSKASKSATKITNTTSLTTPTSKKLTVDLFVLEDSNSTVKSSEKPPG